MIPFAIFHSFGPWEVAVIGGVALLIFGNRLPSVMRSLGKSVTEFKRGMHSIEEEIDDEEAPSSEPKKSEAAAKDA